MTKPESFPLMDAAISAKMHGDYSSTGLKLPEDLTADMWVAVGKTLMEIDSRLQWSWGDWWTFGEHKHGERTAIVDAPDWTGPTNGTLRNYALVCNRFENGSRMPELSFTHHKVCAGSKIAHRDRLMKKAAKEGWSARELENQVRQMEGKAPKEKPKLKAVTTSYHEEEQAPAVHPLPADIKEEIEAIKQPAASAPKPAAAKKQNPAQAKLEAALNLAQELNTLLGGDGVLDRYAKDTAAQAQVKRRVHLIEFVEIVI